MRKDRGQLPALAMIEERADLVAGERPGEPLHIVFHEHLDRGAIDRATAFDRHVRAAADRHVRAEKKGSVRRLGAANLSRRLGIVLPLHIRHTRELDSKWCETK